MEPLVTFGSEVKALGNGRVGGYLVRFSDETSPDLAGEYFNKQTDFYIEPGDKRFVLYDHGFDETLGRAKIGKGMLVKVDDIGLWVEAQLGIRDSYEKAVDAKKKAKLKNFAAAIYQMAEQGKLGWSSGAAGHLARRVEGKSAHWLSEWGITEFSLTPRPAEPRNMVLPLKAYQELQATPLDQLIPKPGPEPKSIAIKFGERITQIIADREEDGQARESVIKSLAAAAVIPIDEVELIISENRRPSNAVIKAFARVLKIDYDLLRDLADRGTPKTIKQMFEEQSCLSVWEIQSALAVVVKKIAEAAEKSREVGNDYDWQKQIMEASKEHTMRMTDVIKSQVETFVNGEADDEFHLKTSMVMDGLLVTGGLDLDEHSDLVVRAETELIKRFRDNHELRVKAGRVLSEKNRQRLASLMDQMMTAVHACQSLLEETQPMASDIEKNAAWINHQRIKHQLLRQRIGV